MVHHLHGAVEIERCLRQQVSRVLWRQSCNAQAKSGAARTGFSPSAAIFQRRGYRSLFLDPVIVAKLRIVFCQMRPDRELFVFGGAQQHLARSARGALLCPSRPTTPRRQACH